jgi:hypothetical protein
MKQKKRLCQTALILALMLLTIGCSDSAAVSSVSPIPTTTPSEQPSPSPSPSDSVDWSKMSPTTGKAYNGVYKPIAVIIENHPDARPQSGISQADIVYEFVMEGRSITRWLCIFNDSIPKVAGPIRSARIYFVSTLREWKSGFVHFGGAFTPMADVYALFPEINIPVHADGWKGGLSKLFWRDKSRSAPHNAYINLEDVLAKMPDVTPEKHLSFSNDVKPQGTQASTLKVHYSTSNIIRYEYDAETGLYTRYSGDKAYTDKNNKEKIQVNNIIIQRTTIDTIKDPDHHLDIKMVGSGKAEYFVGGVYFKGTWERKSKDDKTIFSDEQGNEIKLTPGKTWINVVSNDTQVDAS